MKTLLLAVATVGLVARAAAGQTPPSGAIVWDTFTGADGTSLSTHQPDIDTPNHAWAVTGTTFVLRGQQLQPSAYDPNGQFATAMIDTGLSDGTIAVDWTPAAAAATNTGFPIGALIVRGVDSNNYLAVGYGIWGANTLVVAKFVAGNWTLIGSATLGAVSGQHHLEARLSGANIEAWWDGVRQITATDSTFQLATKQGFRWWTGYDWISTFDNFSVAPTAPPPPPSTTWNLSGNNIYSANTGNVGIGTASPAAKLQVEGNVVVHGNIGALYQDVAEWVPAKRALDAGTVVVAADGTVVDASRRPYDTAVVGVVSPRPGIVLGEAGDDKVLVAQSGRVRVKVDASYGAVRVGDLLVTSPKPGVAMRSKPLNVGGAAFHRPGTLLGKALEPLPNGEGEILVLLTLQ